MPDDTLKPIPTPLKQRWNDLRVVHVPVLTFLILTASICWMWGRYIHPSNIIGEVEPVRANIISVVPGTLQELKVDILQPVTNGQELAVLVALEADQLNAELIAVEAELRLMKRRMDLDKTRNLSAYARLRADWLTERLELDLARIRLQEAEAEYQRVQKLFERQIVSRGVSLNGNTGLDVAKRDRDALRSEIASRERTAADLAASLERLQAIGLMGEDTADPGIEQAIQAQRERIDYLQRPVVLRSSIDGFVSAISNHPGERVSAGDPILVVSGRSSDRILAWIRQPVTLRPRAGDILEVRRMAMGQARFKATVVEVGSQMEPISRTLMPTAGGIDRIEVGLPLLVKADQVFDLIPGEAVQLRFVKSARDEKEN